MPERRSPWLPIAALLSLLVGCGDSENPPPGPTDAGPRVVESGDTEFLEGENVDKAVFRDWLLASR